MSFKNKYPYGYMQTSASNLLDGSGNLNGSAFYVPSYCDQCFLDLLSTDSEGIYTLQRHNGVSYDDAGVLVAGEETQVEIQAGDLLRIVVSGSPGDELYSYAVGLRDDLADYSSSESSSSSTHLLETSSSSSSNSSSVSSSSVSSSSESSSSVSSSSLSKSSSSDLYSKEGIISGGSGSNFGHSIAMDADNRMIIGAYDLQEVYVYEWDDESDIWVAQQTITNPTAQSGENFGYSVDVSGDALIIGARYADTHGFTNNGIAYIYRRNGGVDYGVWELDATLSPSDRNSGDYFGVSVAIYGTKAVVGSYGGDAAYVYTYSSGVWTSTQILTGSGDDDYFGWSVDINANLIMVGAPQADNNSRINSGSVYFFKWSGSSYVEIVRFDGEVAGEGLGSCVSMDSLYAAASAPASVEGGASSGKVYIYLWTGFSWILPAGWEMIGANSEQMDRVSVSGTSVLVGGYKYNSGRGRAKLFKYDGVSAWNLSQTIEPTTSNTNQYFGWDVAIHDNNLAIARYVYNEVSWYQRAVMELSSTGETYSSSSSSSLSSSSTLELNTSSSSISSSSSSESSSSNSSSGPPGFDHPDIDAYDEYLIANWNMEQAGSDSRLDIHHFNHFTPSGSPSTRAGVNSLACDFDDASSHYLVLSDNAEISPIDNMAVSVWFQLDDTAPPSGNYVIFEKENSFGIYYNKDGVLDTDLTFYITQSNYFTKQVGEATIPDTNWHNAVLIADGDYLHGYLDGVLINSVTYDGTLNNSTGSMYVGRRAYVALDYLDGGVDEMAFWNGIVFADGDARAAFVTALWNGGSGKFYEIAEPGWDTSSSSSFSYDAFARRLISQDYVYYDQATYFADQMAMVPVKASSSTHIGNVIIYSVYNDSENQWRIRALIPQDTNAGRLRDSVYYKDILVANTASDRPYYLQAVSCAYNQIFVAWNTAKASTSSIYGMYSVDGGSTWSATGALGNSYYGFSLKNISGMPAFSTSSANPPWGVPYFRRATSSSGATWASPTTLSFTCFATALVEMNTGYPMIAFCTDGGGGSLYVLRASNAAGTTSWAGPYTVSVGVNYYQTYSDQMAFVVEDTYPTIMGKFYTTQMGIFRSHYNSGGSIWYGGLFDTSVDATNFKIKAVGTTDTISNNTNLTYSWFVYADVSNILRWYKLDGIDTSNVISTTSLYPPASIPSTVSGSNFAINGATGGADAVGYCAMRESDHTIVYSENSGLWTNIESSKAVKALSKNSIVPIRGDRYMIAYNSSTAEAAGFNVYLYDNGSIKNWIFPHYRSSNGTAPAAPASLFALKYYDFVGMVYASDETGTGEGTGMYFAMYGPSFDTWTTYRVIEAEISQYSGTLWGNAPMAAAIDTSGNILFAHSGQDDAAPEIGDWVTQELNFTANTSYPILLREINGMPAMVYSRSGEIYLLRYEPDEWTETKITGADGALDYDFNVFAGYPAFVFKSFENDLRCVIASDVNGTSWNDAFVIDSESADTGGSPSITFDGNLPCIYYQDVTNGNVRFTRATRATGDQFGNRTTVYYTGTSGSYIAGTVIDSDPACLFTLTYYDSQECSLMLIKSGQIGGLSSSSSSSTSQPSQSDSSSEANHFSSWDINQHASNLYSYWTFDDSLVNQNGVTLFYSSTTNYYDVGAYRTGLVLTSGTSIHNNSGPMTPITSGVAISCWPKVTTQSDDMYMFEMTKLEKSNISLYYKGSTDVLEFNVRELAGTVQTISVPSASTYFTAGVFHNVVAIATGTDLKLYVDGALVGSGTFSGDFAENAEMKVGVDEDQNYSEGIMDELAVWTDITFTDDGAAFVSALYNSGNGDFYRR